MKINLDKDIMDLLMPDCRVLDVKPHIRVKEILTEYYSTKRVKNEGNQQGKFEGKK